MEKELSITRRRNKNQRFSWWINVNRRPFNNYLGNEKKEYVITKLNQFAIENNIDFDKEKLDERIEKLIKLSKNVNYKKNNNNDLKFELGKKDKE